MLWKLYRRTEQGEKGDRRTRDLSGKASLMNDNVWIELRGEVRCVPIWMPQAQSIRIWNGITWLISFQNSTAALIWTVAFFLFSCMLSCWPLKVTITTWECNCQCICLPHWMWAGTSDPFCLLRTYLIDWLPVTLKYLLNKWRRPCGSHSYSLIIFTNDLEDKAWTTNGERKNNNSKLDSICLKPLFGPLRSWIPEKCA